MTAPKSSRVYDLSNTIGNRELGRFDVVLSNALDAHVAS